VSSLKVLIVEDDLASLELMTEVFTSLKAEVCPISDSEEAVRLVNQQRFDGIFLDLDMPSPNGFQLARLIRKSSWNKSTPIVIVTGLEDRQIMQQAFSLGATFYLQKPIDRRKLSALFRTVRGGMLENRRRHIRVPLQSDVTCTLGARTMTGVSWNLSQGGMQVEIGQLPPTETVRLTFRIPVSDKAIDAIGVVVWSKETRQGIQFTNVSTQDREAIGQFVDSVEKLDAPL
jgi:CheY-like chemotaxis protein